MENDAPSPQKDVLARRTRTHEFRILDLEAENAVLRLQNTHHIEDNAAVYAQRDEYKADRDRYKAERDEVRGKYESLKRTLKPPKRKYEPDADGEQRDAGLHGENLKSPVDESCSPTTKKLPDLHSKPREQILRKPGSLANEHEHRAKIDPAFSPDMRSPDMRSSLNGPLPPTNSLLSIPASNSSSSNLPSNSSPSIPASSFVSTSNSSSSALFSMNNLSYISEPPSGNSLFLSTSPPSSPLMDQEFQANAHLKDKDTITKRFPVPLSTPNPRTNIFPLPPRPATQSQSHSQSHSRAPPICVPDNGRAKRPNQRNSSPVQLIFRLKEKDMTPTERRNSTSNSYPWRSYDSRG
ncbi:hypothetical protein K438DRAFT_2082485 [Mycena galopus ATCC 62051]|nr:hypothetical protein K438DRAFT_2082485 [Mycena galopus ATCC 62051]